MRPWLGYIVVRGSPMVEAWYDGVFVFMFLFVVGIVYEEVVFVIA